MSPAVQLVLKGAVSGFIVVAASQLAQRSSVWAAILVSLPLTSMLAMVWLYVDTRQAGPVVDLSWAILLVVGPSVVFFAALPLLVRLGLAIPPAMVGAAAIMVGAYAVYAWALARVFGIRV